MTDQEESIFLRFSDLGRDFWHLCPGNNSCCHSCACILPSDGCDGSEVTKRRKRERHLVLAARPRNDAQKHRRSGTCAPGPGEEDGRAGRPRPRRSRSERDGGGSAAAPGRGECASPGPAPSPHRALQPGGLGPSHVQPPGRLGGGMRVLLAMLLGQKEQAAESGFFPLFCP